MKNNKVNGRIMFTGGDQDDLRNTKLLMIMPRRLVADW